MPEPAPRITALDALRGVGILGILPVHMQSFAMVVAARLNPSVGGDLDGANGWIWLATAVLADGKFLAIFAMLFGAGLLLLPARGTGVGDVERLHHRRMALLGGIGLLHAYLLWYGDMLVSFALCGALVLASVIALGVGASMRWWPEDLRAGFRQAAISRATISGVGPHTWNASGARYAIWATQPPRYQIETSQLVLRGLWQTSGLMLIGMGLFKLGVLTAARSARFYAAMTAVGIGLGLPLAWAGVARSRAHAFRIDALLPVTG